MRCLNWAEVTLFKEQIWIESVVKHAVLRDIVVSDWSSGKKSSETDSDETGTKLEVF